MKFNYPIKMYKIFADFIENVLLWLADMLMILIPLALMLGGGGFFILSILSYLMGYITFDANDTSLCWGIPLSLLFFGIGIKWDDAIINAYSGAVESKKNSENQKKS
jgi:hypothetical protein